MNACELDLVRNIKLQYSNQNLKEIIEHLHTSGNIPTSLNKTELFNQITELLKEGDNIGVKVNSTHSLHDLFIINEHFNPQLYSQVKNLVKEVISDRIFNHRSGICWNNRILNVALKQFKPDNPITAYTTYTEIKNRTISNPQDIAEYLINNHLSTVINTWYKDVITFDATTSLYKWAPKEHNRKDWYDDDDTRDMPISSILETLCSTTPICKFGDEITPIPNMYITKYSLYYAISEVVKDIKSNAEAYKNFLDNPITIIDYIIGSKWGDFGKSSDSLGETIIKSFIYKWINDGYRFSNLYNNSITTNAKGYNPLNIIIAAATKFQSNTYVEYDVNGNDKKLELSLNGGPVYMQWLDNISRIVEVKTFTNEEGKLDISYFKYVPEEDNNNAILNAKVRLIFGYNEGITSANKQIFIDAINQIFQHISAIKNGTFQESLKEEQNMLMRVFPIVNKYNPHAIVGSIRNNADKSLPTIGLSSVGSKINEEVDRNRMYSEKQRQIWGKKYISKPYEHTKLFGENIKIDTEYRSSIKNGEYVKEPNEMSKPEAIKTAFLRDFLPGYKNGMMKTGDRSIRIQAITPSDKTRIPLFIISDWESYTKNGGIEQNAKTTIHSMYESALKNSVMNILRVLYPSISETSQDLQKELLLIANNKNLLEQVDQLNKFLKKYKVNQNILNEAIYTYNTKGEGLGVNILIADKLDYYTYGKGEDAYIQISPYSIAAVKHTDPKSKGWNDLYNKFEKELKLYITAKDAGYKNESDFNKAIKDFFYLKLIISEEILANTVGLPLAHKTKAVNKESVNEITLDDYLDMDSGAHITMVKRMVALTATMQPCVRGVITGLPNKINMVTVKNEELQITTYSGNAAEGRSHRSKFTVSDGAMWCCRFTQNMFNQSVADTMPEGIDTKLLLHSFNETVGSSHLSKLANFIIDNHILRMFGDPDIEKVGGTNPYKFMQLSLIRAKFKPISFDSNGRLIDFNGRPILFTTTFKKNGHIYTISSRNVQFTSSKFIAVGVDENGNKQIFEADNNLYSFWENILGGAFSCNKEGIFNEDSQDIITSIINQVGSKSSENVKSQNDVDQYLKKQINHYFCSDSAQKSLQCPIVDINKITDYNKMYAIKMNIEHFGIQLNADHSATDGRIREISQLISFICEKGYLPEKVDKIYTKLAELTQMLVNKVIVNVEFMENSEGWIKHLNNIIGPRLTRSLSDPNANVQSLAGEIVKEIEKYNRTASNKLNIPYSDAQIVSKFHTTVGSYMNKFISRSWSGRADVLVPSHNMFMVYEDANGNTLLYNDSFEGKSAKEHLRAQVWADYENRILRSDLPLIDAYEISMQDVYYNADNPYEVIVVDNYDKLMKVHENIMNGTKYVRALDLPRNLRSKRCFVEINGQKHNLYFFKTLREIMNLGIQIEEATKKGADKAIIDELYEQKKDKQLYFEQVVLPSIKDPEIIEQELGIQKELIQSIEYVSFDSERLTTNYYENSFGIRDMNFAEILESKELYFYKKLKDKFELPEIDLTKSDVVLYDISGNVTIVKDDESKIPQAALPIEVIVNEDGYRIDDHGNKLYKWPKYAKLYTYQIGELKYEIIKLNDPEDISILDKSGNFIIQRSSKLGLSTLPNFGMKLSITEENILRRIAKDQYYSWLQSNKAIVARIPSQSLSFGMAMVTVGYLPYKNNITMVPNEHVYIQGSDYDIDKVYAMMCALDRRGFYKNYNKVIIDNKSELDDYSKMMNQRFAQHIITANSNPVDFVELWLRDTLQLQETIIINVNEILSSLDALGMSTSDEIKQRLDEALKLFQDELSYRKCFVDAYDDDSDSLQNYILENIIDVYHDPKTLVGANTPTTMDPVNNTVEDLGLGKSRRNHLYPFTDIHLNQTTAVGRTDIGISAVGQKAFYALTYQHILSSKQEKNIVKIITYTWPHKEGNITATSLGFSVGRWNQASINSIYEFLGNKKSVQFGDFIISKDAYEEVDGTHVNTIKINGKLIKIGDFLSKDLATSINSAIISSSTDNAKEMKMDLLNATPEILSGYEYLIGIGIPLNIAARIFTDPIIPCLITQIRGDIYNSSKKPSRSQTRALNNLSYDTYVKSLPPDVIPDNEELFNAKKKVLTQIFKGANELSIVGRTLGINQGIDVEFGDPLLYQLRIERDVNSLVEDDKTITSKFSYERFMLGDEAYQQEWINNVQRNSISFNVLDIIKNVPHFFVMLKIPLYFKKTVEKLSKNVLNTYKCGSTLYKEKYVIDTKAIKRISRVFNDRMIYQFLTQLDLEYKTNFSLTKENKINTNAEESRTMSIKQKEGLVLLKKYIEDVIIDKHLKTKYEDNGFVQNLIYNSQIDSLFNLRTKMYASKINTTEKQTEDLINGLKYDFYQIQNKIVEGHTIYEWMWIYNALCHKNQVGKRTLGVFLDKFDLSDENNIMRKWIEFVNTYDQDHIEYESLDELYSIGLKTMQRISTIDDFMDDVPRTKNVVLPGFIDPKIFPLFVKMDMFTRQLLKNENRLSKLMTCGKIIVIKC